MSETVFNKVDYTLASILGEIELGQIGLPDIQRPFVDSVNGDRVMAVHCLPASKPVFLSDKSVERFYVRTLSSTTELKGSDAQHYISERF